MLDGVLRIRICELCAYARHFRVDSAADGFVVPLSKYALPNFRDAQLSRSFATLQLVKPKQSSVRSIWASGSLISKGALGRLRPAARVAIAMELKKVGMVRQTTVVSRGLVSQNPL